MRFLFIIRNLSVICLLLSLNLTSVANREVVSHVSSTQRNPYHNHILQSDYRLLSHGNSEWFQDTRIKLDLNALTNQHEITLGIAHRKNLSTSGNTFGAYAFWDISHIKESVFAQQNTFGIEWFNSVVHIASNIYQPLPHFIMPFEEQSLNPRQQAWKSMQQNHIKSQIKTLSGTDINLHGKVITSKQNNYGLMLRYAYFTSPQHTEQGPELGISYTHRNTHSNTHLQVYGRYDSPPYNHVGIRAEQQWTGSWSNRKNPSPQYPNPSIKRDVNIRFSPIKYKPYLKVANYSTQHYPQDSFHGTNQVLEQYLLDRFTIIWQDKPEEDSDLLIIASDWLRYFETRCNAEELATVANTIKKIPAKYKIFWTTESDNSTPHPLLLDALDLMVGFDITVNPKYHRFPFAYNHSWAKNFSLHYDPNVDRSGDNYPLARKEGCQPQNKKYFACFLASHASTGKPGAVIRYQLFQALEKYKFVASGGSWANNIDSQIESGDHAAINFTNQCKFMIASENEHHLGYITEKPFRAWLSGAVPIYDAHPSVKQDLNPKSIIFQPDFVDQEALITEVKRLDQDDKAYCDMWNQNIIHTPSQEWHFILDQTYQRLDQLFEQEITGKSSWFF